MNFRQAGSDDASAIAAVLHDSDLKSIRGESPETTAENVAGNLQQVMDGESSAVFVAETPDNQLAGYCAVHHVPFVFLPGGEAYISELFVRPQWSGQGIGSKLLELAIEAARRWGCARVSLLNRRDRESYRRGFYAKHGFQEREQLANFVLPLNSPR